MPTHPLPELPNHLASILNRTAEDTRRFISQLVEAQELLQRARFVPDLPWPPPFTKELHAAEAEVAAALAALENALGLFRHARRGLHSRR